MGKFFDYNPDQAYLLPPSVRDVLGAGHLCFFIRRVLEKLNHAGGQRGSFDFGPAGHATDQR